MPLPDLWTRVRKARLAQVLAVYLGASWVLLQVTDALVEALQLPGWVSPVVVLLLLVGLLIVGATAWIQSHPLVREREAAGGLPQPWALDVRDLGRAVRSGRFPHLTWARALGGGAVVFSLLIAGAGGYALFRGDVSPRPLAATSAAPGIAVLPFEARGVADELWGEGLLDLLSTNLDGVGGLRAIESRTVLARWREAPAEAGDLGQALRVAGSTGARFAVTGSVVGSGSRVRVAARLYEVATGAEAGQATVEGSPEDVLDVVDRLSVELLRDLLTRSELSDLAPRSVARITTSSVPALRAFLRGEAANRRADFSAAAGAFEEALAADSTFALAAYRLGMAYGWMLARGADEAQRLMEYAARFSDRLPARDAALVRGYHGALREGDPNALTELQGLSTAFPDDPEVWYMLGEARFHFGHMLLIPRDDAADAFDRAIALDSAYAPAYIHLIEIRLGEGRDSAAVRRLLDAYAAIAADDTRLGALRFAHHVIYEGAGSAPAAVDTLPGERMVYALSTFGRAGVGAAPANYELVRLIGRSGRGSRFGPRFETNSLGLLGVATGRIREAVRSAEAASLAAAAQVAYEAGVLYDQPLPDPLVARVMAVDSAAPPDALFHAAVVAAHLGRDDVRQRAIEALRRLEAGRQAAARGAAAPQDAARPGEPGTPPGAPTADLLADAIDGFARWRRGDLDGAAERLEQVRVASIGYGGREVVNARARLWLGAIEAARGRHEQALRYLRACPGDAYAVLLAAESLEALGRRDDARRAYADALRIWAAADEGFEPADRARRGVSRLQADA